MEAAEASEPEPQPSSAAQAQHPDLTEQGAPGVGAASGSKAGGKVETERDRLIRLVS